MSMSCVAGNVVSASFFFFFLPRHWSAEAGTHTGSGRGCATSRHLGDGSRLTVGVKVRRNAQNLRGYGLGEAGRGGRGLGAGSLVGWGLGKRFGAGALLRDGRQAGKARDAIGALSFEAVLRGVLVVTTAMACGG